jgi:perosamine synthetase
MLPTLSWRSLNLWQPPPMTLWGSATPRTFTRGRYALNEAFRSSGVGPHGALMAPAYHCRTMLDPAIRLGADIVLYPLLPDLSPDLAGLKAALARSKKPVKALLLTHFFGFAQAMGSIAAFCEEHHIAMIEDCTHSPHLEPEPNASGPYAAMGRTGRFGVASPYKFFPAQDGGLLWANHDAHPPATPQRDASLGQEFKNLLRSVQALANRARPSRPPKHGALIPSLRDRHAEKGTDRLEQAEGTSSHYDASLESLKQSAWSAWLIRHTHLPRLARQRRAHYLQWADAVAPLANCQALWPVIPEVCTPYVFPLLIKRPELHFYALKQLGVPVWRWDDMAVSDCPVASDYRLKLLHLPCHQELSHRQMTWMTRTVIEVMTQVHQST